MEGALLALIAFLGIFTCAFGMTWFMPLCAVTQEAQKEQPASKVELGFAGADLFLLLLDSIPIFWIFSLLFSRDRNKPKSKAQYKWKEEPAIRRCFYLWLASLSALIATIALASNL